MIGGNDIVIPAAGTPASLEACVRAIRQYWPHARFENAETAEKYTSEIPFGRLKQLLAYPDEEAESMWDQDSPDSPINSIVVFDPVTGFGDCRRGRPGCRRHARYFEISSSFAEFEPA
jgi:hypothetical protein